MINQLSIILLCLSPDYFILSNTRLFTHQGESADTQLLHGLKNIETKCLTEAAKFFIAVWCNSDIYFVCKDRSSNIEAARAPFAGGRRGRRPLHYIICKNYYARGPHIIYAGN